MSRHRHFHAINQNYDEYDDGYEDDDYGTGSYSDNYCVSPGTAAEFTFNRDRRADTSFADYLSREEEREIPEESEEEAIADELDDSSHYVKPQLTDEQEAQLQSCLDMIRDIMGETIPDHIVTQTVIANGFDSEKSLDALLQINTKPPPSKPPSGAQGDGLKPGARQTPGVVLKLPTPKTQKTEQKTSAVFHIGDTVTSDDDTDARLSESTAQLNIKPSNGATLSDKKETKPNAMNTPLRIKSLIESETGRSSPSLSRSGSKAKLERLDAAVEYEKRTSEGKDLINLVVIGHVDAGKSTLMGHVLYQLGVVSQRQMHRYEMDSKKLGKASFMYAWVLDETEEERNRGVTMDVAQTRFETGKKIINLLDAPGHKDFIPNMITGAAQADCALLVVNATNGEFETGFESGGQTREHTLLIRSLGVAQLVVAINKMDTVNWSQQRYLEIASKLSVFLKQAGFKDADTQYIPCSGLNGVNLVKSAKDIPELSWYTGKPLIDEIENFKPPERLVNKPMRMCVQDLFKPAQGQGGNFSVSGRMEAGDLQNGDKVLVMPAAEPAFVKGITIDESPEKIGFAGDSVTVQLTAIDIQKVHVGCVLCDMSAPIPVVTRFRARLVIFNITLPITKGSPAVYHSQSLNEPANITRLISQLNKTTGEVIKSKPRCLTKNMTAVVEITLTRPLPIELYKDYKDLGRFMLRNEGHTIAAGIVTELLPTKTQ